MKLYLARHGESESNVKMLLYGWTDSPLTEKGRQDAAALGEKLRALDIARCYSSTLCRASETAQIALSGREIPIDYLPGLREQNMGDFENVSFPELAAKRPDLIKALLEDWTAYPPPGGESYTELKARVYPCLEEMIARDENALIVAHNGPLCAIMARLLDMEPRSIDKFAFKHGCWSSVELKDGRARLEYFNK